ncbi:hypothetical protein HNR19_002919 [Nocardioides thalensis]|uniref:Uncharacterized protein n=1 Tax=Nocardioides thalensis TaxID=1914755 RepID=A0A853C4Z0_9ACTN|nr:hypothetical protein [Nocardioides thalensis]NYJ02221.1 hypothetical protein [Nocardioides thalensis]
MAEDSTPTGTLRISLLMFGGFLLLGGRARGLRPRHEAEIVSVRAHDTRIG